MAASMKSVMFQRTLLYHQLKCVYGGTKSYEYCSKANKAGNETQASTTSAEKNPKNLTTSNLIKSLKLFDKAVSNSEETEARLKDIPNYREHLSANRKVARRTVLVKTKDTDKALKELESFGDIESHHIVNGCLLAVFRKLNSLTHLTKQLGSLKENYLVCSRKFLLHNPPGSHKALHMENNGKLILTKTQTESLKNCDSVSQQMEMFHSLIKMSEGRELAINFNCHVMEQFLSCVLPMFSVEEFGSCVNGFGSMTSDIDLTILPTDQIKDSKFQFMYTHTNPDSFDLLTDLSRLLKKHLPIVNQIMFIKGARVPVIKCVFEATNIDCDISAQPFLKGIRTSEILYIYSKLDPRIPVLFSTVKAWASSNLLRKEEPGNWFSSFQLLMLVIFFFQSRPSPSIPTIAKINQFMKGAVFQNTVVNYPPLTSIQALAPSNDLSKSVEELLHDFFKFYVKFDFQDRGLCLVSGRGVPKLVDEPGKLYIKYPFDEYNITKNLSEQYFTSCIKQMKCALDILENPKPDSQGNWGILDFVTYHWSVHNTVMQTLFSGTDLNLQSLDTVIENVTSSRTSPQHKKRTSK